VTRQQPGIAIFVVGASDLYCLADCFLCLELHFAGPGHECPDFITRDLEREFGDVQKEFSHEVLAKLLCFATTATVKQDSMPQVHATGGMLSEGVERFDQTEARGHLDSRAIAFDSELTSA